MGWYKYNQIIVYLLLIKNVKMKKTLVYLIAVLTLLFGGTVLAQEISDSGSSDPGNPNASDLWDLKVRFCDWTGSLDKASSLFINTKAGKEEEICVYVQNTWPTPMKIGLNFVDWAYTQWWDPKKACLPEWSKDKFGQFVTMWKKEFDIESNGAFETRVKLKFPVGYAGLVNWCVTTRIIKDDEGSGTVKVIARRANFIDVFVDWEFKVDMSYIPFDDGQGTRKNISNSDLIWFYQRINDKRYTTRFSLKNNWNMPIVSTSNVKAKIFWVINKEWNNVISKISAGGTTYIDIDMPVYLKWLWWLTKVSIDSTYTADIDESMPNYKELAGKSYNLNSWASAFIMPRWFIIFVGLILLIIIASSRKSRKQYKSKSNK